MTIKSILMMCFFCSLTFAYDISVATENLLLMSTSRGFYFPQSVIKTVCLPVSADQRAQKECLMGGYTKMLLSFGVSSDSIKEFMVESNTTAPGWLAENLYNKILETAFLKSSISPKLTMAIFNDLNTKKMDATLPYTKQIHDVSRIISLATDASSIGGLIKDPKILIDIYKAHAPL